MTFPEIKDDAILVPMTVASGTVRHGMPVVLSGSGVAEATAVGNDVIGVAYSMMQNVAGAAYQSSIGFTAAVGAKIMVARLGKGIVPVRVGTGGTATAGSPAGVGTAGCTNQTIGGGTTKAVVVGRWTQSGSPGELVGCNLAESGYTSTA